jgi:hypothetical protein
MIVGYLGSAAFHNLAVASQNEYRRVFERLRRDYGDLGSATLARKHVVRMLDAKAAHPAAARGFLRCLRLLIAYAISIGARQDDPTAGVRVKLPRSDGFRTWTEEDIAAFEGAPSAASLGSPWRCYSTLPCAVPTSSRSVAGMSATARST